MYSINDELKDRITELSQQLENKYKDIFGEDKGELRKFISMNVGEIKQLENLQPISLENLHKRGGIVGVDGSNNKVGGAYPHFVEVYQSLAKSTIRKHEPLFKSDIYSPLILEQDTNPLEEKQDMIEEKRNIKLATLEVEAALESIGKFQPYVIMMDGGLIRYNIYANDKWMELRGICEEKGIILLGVIKDIKTKIIGDILSETEPSLKGDFYDRELLFGVLNYGEIILIKDTANRKEPEGYASAFIRSSMQPSVIGMDIIDSQREHMEEMARLIFTLTPENSRGVPLWLDIVDKEVKISDAMMKGLLERYMDKGIYDRFFVSEREKRT